MHIFTFSCTRSPKYFEESHTQLQLYSLQLPARHSLLCSNPFMTMNAPFKIFNTSPRTLHLHPRQPSVPREIKFLLKLVTCLAPIKTLSHSSNILILTFSILTIHMFATFYMNFIAYNQIISDK